MIIPPYECLSCEREIAPDQLPLCPDCLKARHNLTHPNWTNEAWWQAMSDAARIKNASEARYAMKQQTRPNRFIRMEIPA